jgi:hypothetical protein
MSVPNDARSQQTSSVSHATELMKKIRNRRRPKTGTRKGKRARFQKQDYSTLVFIGGLMALILLSGCASGSQGGSADPTQYNTNTGYPAVGGSMSGQ